MYCFKCGNKLEKKKIRTIIKKDDPNYYNDILGHSTIGMDRKEQISYIYKCPNCNLEITYEKQCIISKKQKDFLHPKTQGRNHAMVEGVHLQYNQIPHPPSGQPAN